MPVNITNNSLGRKEGRKEGRREGDAGSVRFFFFTDEILGSVEKLKYDVDDFKFP